MYADPWQECGGARKNTQMSDVDSRAVKMVS